MTVVAPDRPGLLWRWAGVLSLHRLAIRSATATSVATTAVTVFEVEPRFGSPPDWSVVRADVRRAYEDALPIAAQLADRERAYARDAVYENGEIVIETEMQESEPIGSQPGTKHVVLSVRDNGVGIAPEVRDRIFDPFFTTKDVGKGTGLGLSAVYGIVQQARGTLSVKSSVGEGTVVTACFPAQQNDPTRVQVGRRRTVLLVEDQDSLRTLVAEVLSARGFTVISARSSEEALQAFAKAERIDLLLTDISLGEMSGTELAFRLSNRYPKLGVLFTSGYLPELPFDSQMAGHFLAKPFTAEALMAKIDEILAKEDG